MKVFSIGAKTVTVTLDLEAVEFIADELPNNDGFTKDWREFILNKMYSLREDDGRP